MKKPHKVETTYTYNTNFNDSIDFCVNEEMILGKESHIKVSYFQNVNRTIDDHIYFYTQLIEGLKSLKEIL